MEVIKRNGIRVPFDIYRILDAADKAFIEVTGIEAPEEFRLSLTDRFAVHTRQQQEMHLEQIQNIIEDTLMGHGHYDVARAYILHREKHRESRLIRERIEYMDSYGRSGVNAASSSETDANANVGIKNVANLNGEVYKTLNRKIQRYRMRKKLKEMFPEVEQSYEQDIEDHIIYPHDESSTPVVENYCEAVSMFPFVQHGTSTLDGMAAAAPKNMSSFAGQFVNCVFLLAAQCKGAVAVGEVMNVFDHYCVKDFGEDYHLRTEELASIYPRKTIGQMIDQYFQQIVYSINQPAGNRSFQ